jgi:hypothetical protein
VELNISDKLNISNKFNGCKKEHLEMLLFGVIYNLIKLYNKKGHMTYYML